MATTRTKRYETVDQNRDYIREARDAGAELRDETHRAGSHLMESTASVMRAATWPVEFWLRGQSNMLRAIEPLAKGWIERRQEAANATVETWQRLAQCNDLQEAVAVQRNWIEGSVQRLNADLRAFADHATAISREALAVASQAGQGSAEAAGGALHPAERAQHELAQATEQG